MIKRIVCAVVGMAGLVACSSGLPAAKTVQTCDAACVSSVVAAQGAPTPATRTATESETVTETESATVPVTERPVVQRIIATRTHTATVTYHPPAPKQYGEGTYVVGSDIKPGTYHTNGADDCYWARLSSLNTDDIIDNNNTTGPATIEVHFSDKALEIEGDCTFGRVSS